MCASVFVWFRDEERAGVVRARAESVQFSHEMRVHHCSPQRKNAEGEENGRIERAEEDHINWRSGVPPTPTPPVEIQCHFLYFLELYCHLFW